VVKYFEVFQCVRCGFKLSDAKNAKECPFCGFPLKKKYLVVREGKET